MDIKAGAIIFGETYGIAQKPLASVRLTPFTLLTVS